jgi:cytochrome c oxidase assembly factor CtaG
VASTAVLWLWHLPVVYDAALQHHRLHDLEHVCFVLAGLMYWWPVVNPAPHVRGHVPHERRIVYLVLGALGLLLTLSPRMLYPAYASGSGVWGLTPHEDQAWGGVIMWSLGGAIDMLAVLVLLFRYFTIEERKSLRVAVT